MGVREALSALSRGEVSHVLAALRSIGPSAEWAVAALRHAAALSGRARSAALAQLAASLRQGLRQSAAPVDLHRLQQLQAANQAMYENLLARVERFLAQLLTQVLGRIAAWLAQGHHYVYVLGFACLLALLWVAVKYGALLPRGASNALYGDAAARLGPSGIWREAQERWRRGDHLGALALGRSAVVARLDQGGLLRAAPGISDREIERKLARSPLGEAARAFRSAHAYGRWAGGRDEAIKEAWEQLGQLWRGGQER